MMVSEEMGDNGESIQAAHHKNLGCLIMEPMNSLISVC